MDIRKVNSQNCIMLRNLAKRCKPLDVHTPYTYWVVCYLFGDGCFLLLDKNEPVGYILTVIKEDSLFIWQIGILENFREKKFSGILLNAVTQYAQEKKCKKMLVSISPENENSYHAFHQFCKHNNFLISHCGDVNLIDSFENFSEFEHIYQIDI